MLRTTIPDVTPTGRYSKAEACRRLGEQHKPIAPKSLNKYMVLIGITPHMSKSMLHVYITGADILRIWKHYGY